MNFLFDTSIDVNRRQFYVLAMGSCIGNLAGFIGNALIFGWNGTTIFCGICMLLMAAGSFIGIKKGQIRYASYLMIAVLSLVEFPTLYYIYQTGTIVYMVLAMVAIAIFIPTGNAIRFAGIVIVADVAAVILAYMRPLESEKLSKEVVLQSTLCSLLIVLLCVFLISILLAPLILPDGDEVNAIRFDALMYGIELAYLVGKKYTKARSDLYKKVAGIASVANIPEIQAQADFINKILNTDYVEQAGIAEFEEIRERLRNLIKYIPKNIVRYDTNFEDDLLSIEWKDSELENDELKNYKAKAEYYIRQHQDNIAIAKLKTNQPLTATDIETLEEILWREVGTKQDYENEFGTKPLGEFVREIVGLDMNAAKEAFSEYLTNTSLDSRQIYFVNQIVEYIVHNGMLKDFSVLQESPFTDQGSVVEIFTDISVWLGIKKVIDTINANAVA